MYLVWGIWDKLVVYSKIDVYIFYIVRIFYFNIKKFVKMCFIVFEKGLVNI